MILGSVDDETLLAEHGLAVDSVDSIVCIGTLCSVKDPAKTVKWLCKLLRPGGSFIFWEHRRSCDFLTRLVQGKFYTEKIRKRISEPCAPSRALLIAFYSQVNLLTAFA